MTMNGETTPLLLLPTNGRHSMAATISINSQTTFSPQQDNNDNDKDPSPIINHVRRQNSFEETKPSKSTTHRQRPRRHTVAAGQRRFSSLLDSSMDDISERFHERLDHLRSSIRCSMVQAQQVLQEPVAVPIKPRDEGDHSKKLSAVALAILVFYKVSGGPFGCEVAVRAAGPFYALVGFLVFPLLWCLPEVLITAELGSAFPEPSGANAWVEEAFGPTTSLLCGYFHWISGATDNAIYPSLFLKYLNHYFAEGNTISTNIDDDPTEQNDLSRFLFTVGITIVLAIINYMGLQLVGNLSMVVCVVSMSPFLLMAILAVPKIDPNRWFVLPDESFSFPDYEGVGLLPTPMYAGVYWRPLLNSLFWNLNQFDVGATFAGEIRDPQTVFPRAMFVSVFLVLLGYLIPLLTALGATDVKQNEWQAGYFTAAATEIAGPWLGIWTVLAAAISNIALFQAEMSGDAYQLLGMAERGMIPKLFGRRSRFGTPTNGILLGTFVIVAVSVADFEELMEMLNFAYSLSLIFEFLAFVKLRITAGNVVRPYRIPLNTFGCGVLVFFPMVFLTYLMLIASKKTYIYLAALIVIGFAFYFSQKLFKHYGWVEYVEAPRRKRKVNDQKFPRTKLWTIQSFGSYASSSLSEDDGAAEEGS